MTNSNAALQRASSTGCMRGQRRSAIINRVSFAVPADAYDRFMGRFAVPLAPLFADYAGIRRPCRVADVGCGPGALTTELVTRLGASSVSAVDPSDGFVSAARERLPGVDVRKASAEELPFPDASFDVTVAQLVVHFMSDPVVGLKEMARVTRTGGLVAACVWDRVQGASGLLWQAAGTVDPAVSGEAHLPGTKKGELARLFRRAGLTPESDTALTLSQPFATFAEWWEPFTLGVGSAGGYVASLDSVSEGATTRTMPLPVARWAVYSHPAPLGGTRHSEAMTAGARRGSQFNTEPGNRGMRPSYLPLRPTGCTGYG